MNKAILMSLILFCSMPLFAFFQKGEMNYELRIYLCEEGQVNAIQNKINKQSKDIYSKHGFKFVTSWKAKAESQNLLYILFEFKKTTERDLSMTNLLSDSAAENLLIEKDKRVKNVESILLKINKDLSKTSATKSKNFKPEGIYEMRTYYMLPGRYPNIVTRFKDHTRKLFEKQGMVNVVYFDTVERDGSQPKLLYFLRHKDEEAAKKAWDGFRVDPDWIKVRDASEESGRIVQKVEAVYMQSLGMKK